MWIPIGFKRTKSTHPIAIGFGYNQTENRYCLPQLQSSEVFVRQSVQISAYSGWISAVEMRLSRILNCPNLGHFPGNVNGLIFYFKSFVSTRRASSPRRRHCAAKLTRLLNSKLRCNFVSELISELMNKSEASIKIELLVKRRIVSVIFKKQKFFSSC